ncbi:MAG: glycoside hydrolase family 3 C-terminal domain-containing protein [Rikenellaceae bacterium]
MKKIFKSLALFAMFSALSVTSTIGAEVWRDSSKSIDERTDDLLSKLNLEEKFGFFSSDIPAIERLGIPKYVWYSEALHGLIGWKCTSFPQNNAMGSTWDTDLMYRVAQTISDEARAFDGKEMMIFSPTVNMSRDPRWGRNEECYSEDPYHMTQMAKMYVRGMQGTHPTYLKTVCTVKHYVANNVDHKRERIHSNISERDLREYYFPAYKACVVEERAAGIMTALNGLNGVPCSANNWLTNTVLRDEWGFLGYVIADWNAVGGVYSNMKYVPTNAEGAAMALKAGVDQECFRPTASKMVVGMKEAYKQGLIKDSDIDKALRRLIRLRFMVGGFGDDVNDPYRNTPKAVLESKEHKALALEAAEKSIVLLKNDQNILPLSDSDIKSVAVVGPFADICWLGIYSGFPQSKITPLQGIKNRFKGEVLYAPGCAITPKNDTLDMNKAIAVAKKSDVVIAFVGNDEKTSTENRDRLTLALPGRQQQLIDELCKVHKKVIVVLIPSGATTIGDAQQNSEAIVCAWANGQEQGNAIARVLFGDVNPGGKLNTTWFRSDSDLPDLHDYNIRNNRTYMYFKGKPLYEFGYGLSYTTFKYADLKISDAKLNAGGKVDVSLTVTNTGKVAGDEIVQLYIKDNAWKKSEAKRQLKGFKRVHLKAGESKSVTIELSHDALSHWAGKGDSFEVSGGQYDILVGSSSEKIHLKGSIEAQAAKLPEHSLRTANYDAYDTEVERRAKGYGHISGSKVAAGVDTRKWVEYNVSFVDPGYYVSSWDIFVNYTTYGDQDKVTLSMEGMTVGTYDIKKGADGRHKITIPKPEYDAPIKVRITSSNPKTLIKSLEVLYPKDNTLTKYSEPSAKSK